MRYVHEAAEEGTMYRAPTRAVDGGVLASGIGR